MLISPLSHDSTPPAQDGSNPYAKFSKEDVDRFCVQKDKEITALRAKDQARMAEHDALWRWLNREGVKPDYKLLVAQVMRRLGIGFKNPNHERWKEFTEIKLKDLARDNGASEKVIGDYMAFMTAPSDQCPDAVLKKKIMPKPRHTQTPDGQWVKTGKMVKQGTYAPPDPLVFTKYFSDPAAVPVPVTTPRQQRNTQHKRDVRAAERADVARARHILAQCPSCGSQDIDLRCHTCGTVTPTNAIPDAPERQGSDQHLENIGPIGTEGSDQHLDIISADSPFVSTPLGTDKTTIGKKSTTKDSVDNEGSDQHLENISIIGTEGSDQHLDITFSEEDSRPEEEDDMEAARVAEVAHLVNGDRDLACVLARAVHTLYPAVALGAQHVVMRPRTEEKANKYVTAHEPLTPVLVGQHLVGSATLGAGLLTSLEDADGPRLCRAVAYDSDDHVGILIVAAKKLADHGLNPLLVRNEAKKASGHLWIFFDRDVVPETVFATLEAWAPALGKVRERFPNPTIKGGGKLRLPAGCYLPVGLDPVPVQVALGAADGDLEWVDALDPLAWVLLAGAVTPAEAVEHAWLPPEARPQPPTRPIPRPAARATAAGGSTSDVRDAVNRFCRDHPLSSQVTLTPRDMFRSPFGGDTTPSAHRRDTPKGERWTDFSGGHQRGGDALDLACVLAGVWPESQEANTPRARVDFLIRENYLQAAAHRTPGCHLERRGDDLLVMIRLPDRDLWRRARDSFYARFRDAGPRYDDQAKATVVPYALAGEVRAWFEGFAATEKAQGGV